MAAPAASSLAGMTAVLPSAPVVARRAGARFVRKVGASSALSFAPMSAATHALKAAAKVVPPVVVRADLKVVVSFAGSSAARVAPISAAKVARKVVGKASVKHAPAVVLVNAALVSGGRGVAWSAVSAAAPAAVPVPVGIVPLGANPSAPDLCGSAASIAVVSAPSAAPW